MKEEKLSPKVEALYRAVGELIVEGVDVNAVKVSDITERAGIGKGTAYEYFKNKEEIISGAVLFQMDAICRQIAEEIIKLNDFSKIIHYILTCMDREIKKRDCFIKYIHILSDNGLISKILKQKIEERNKNLLMPETLLLLIVKIGIKEGNIKAIYPLDYMCLSLGAKLMTYAMYLGGENMEERLDTKQMHELICGGLLKEFN